MKQFYSFENEQGDWTICYGESPDDTESQVICAIDDWHLETVSMLNSIVTEIVNRYADEVRFKTMIHMDEINESEDRHNTRINQLQDKLDEAKDEIFRLQEVIHGIQDARNEAYQLLAECTLRRNASEMRIDYLKSQLSDLVFIKSEDVRTYQRKDELEEWLTELRDNLKNGNTIDNDTLSNEINELLNENN